MCGQPTISHSLDYKSFKFNDKNEGMKVEKADDKTGLEELFVSDLKSQDCGLVLNPLPDEKIGNAARKPLETTEDNANGDHMGLPTCAPNDTEDSKRKSHCTKKGSMDYELPELVVFLQESSYHFVKDICIDKEVPCSKGKCLVENCDLDHKIISCIRESDADGKSESTEHTMITMSSISRGSKPTDEDDYSKNRTKQHGSTKSVTEDLDSCSRDGISIDQSTKEFVPESLLLVREVQKADLTSSMVSPTVEKKGDNNNTSSVTIPDEVESGKGSCHSDLSVATISGTEEPPLGADSHQQPTQTGHTNTTSHDDEISESLTESIPAHQHCIEESSHLSGLMSHHVSAAPSFRSVSHRSNSSTTSSRSFAFPILASDWHGSPERMAKPERPELRKSRGKCMSFLCCKF
ncbi:18S pre-ribosomal assembly protein gar2-like protein [Parasponia andersonii]|uniref:18S pre-ribosomal assembly protein gar2-like protein n=1 Tax=Parasponia andersonii TaxID=3476 RepID=A0A2P5BCB7_PARAD|nr:18S pre-ribosomal assembly protein gar2-like protein [Parasponia andersonii]